MISVIIPVYNTKAYLTRCVNSLIGQTYSDLEIILIDDGSTDGSGDMCDHFASLDKRIRVVHQKNQGQAVARNIGIEIAKGEWIGFVDSDDWLDEEMYESLIKVATEYDAEIVSCLSQDCSADGNVLYAVTPENKTYLFSIDQIADEFVTQRHVRFVVWNKIFKREAIAETRFIPGQISEEIHFLREIVFRINKIAHYDKIYHNYLVSRPGNTMSSFKTARMCVYNELEEFRNDFVKRGDRASANAISYFAARFAMAMYFDAKASHQDKKIQKQLYQHFCAFYSGARGYKKGNSKILILFRFSPFVYNVALKAKSNMKGSK